MTENNIVLYSTRSGTVNVNVIYLKDTFWLSQKAIAQLFAVEVPAISKHLAHIYETGELLKEATVSILETVAIASVRWASAHHFCISTQTVLSTMVG